MKKILIIIISLGILITGILLITSYYSLEWNKSKFDLRDKIPIKIEYQTVATYRSCYAFAALDSIETNIMLKKGKIFDFSESHLEYMTSNLLGGDRQLNEGGGFLSVLSYIGEGNGPVLESEIPNKVYKVEEYEKLKCAKPIVKIVHTKDFLEKDKNFRKNLKKHIVENGSIYAGIYFESPVSESISEFYNNKTYSYCSIKPKDINHVVSIIGWDDNYSKENFPEENKPKKDGAYISMSFWKGFENDHIIYISYEDAMVETAMIGVLECELYGE